MEEVVVVSAVRTAIGNHGGSLATIRPDDLAAIVIKEAVARAGIDANQIEEVFFGCTNQAGEDNRNIARMAGLLAGLPTSVAGVTFNRLCASGLTAINAAARAIRCGEGDVYVVGGVESMSRAPYVMAKQERGFAWGDPLVHDTTIGWRFSNPKLKNIFGNHAMGLTAENLRELEQVNLDKTSRVEQDRFAVQSNLRAISAIDSGRFDDEIIPVEIPQRRGDPIIFDTDERPRRDSTVEKLAKLSPAFKQGGSVTAANSSGLNDGAAALVLMSASKAAELNIEPMATWVASASAGVLPETMGWGPVPATKKVLSRANLQISDLDLVELNEAFAVQALTCVDALGLDESIVNVNGGAVALGHPLGCSGARITVTLLHEMVKRSKDHQGKMTGLATLCVGVGQGEAAIFTRD
ncbi:MAG TPA: acetyl-CoA C-acetyltransferase [Candidatus Poseidoniales archaeon]|nr:acetyl-CoA C-acetyltransferase [Candidatus Poseidoniales archaeon]